MIDFNDLAHDSFDKGVNPLTSGGYTATCAPRHDVNCLGVFGRSNPFQADPGFAAVLVGYESAAAVMTKSGGGSFDFYSIDLADLYNSGASVTINFTFHHSGGGSNSNSVTLDNAIGLERLVFAESNLDSVSWVTTGGANDYGQFDNIATAAVPEPQTYALMLAGLAAVGAITRRNAPRP